MPFFLFAIDNALWAERGVGVGVVCDVFDDGFDFVVVPLMDTCLDVAIDAADGADGWGMRVAAVGVTRDGGDGSEAAAAVVEDIDAIGVGGPNGFVVEDGGGIIEGWVCESTSSKPLNDGGATASSRKPGWSAGMCAFASAAACRAADSAAAATTAGDGPFDGRIEDFVCATFDVFSSMVAVAGGGGVGSACMVVVGVDGGKPSVRSNSANFDAFSFSFVKMI